MTDYLCLLPDLSTDLNAAWDLEDAPHYEDLCLIWDLEDALYEDRRLVTDLEDWPRDDPLWLTDPAGVRAGDRAWWAPPRHDRRPGPPVPSSRPVAGMSRDQWLAHHVARAPKITAAQWRTTRAILTHMPDAPGR